MTTPTERWRSRENPYNVLLTVDAVMELYDYAVQLERHNERMRQAQDRDAQRHPPYGPCDGFDDGACAECNRLFEALQCENKALSVNAENLEIVRKQRDEARDIARKLLGLAKSIYASHRYSPIVRDCYKCDALRALPEWLRREIEA